MSISPDLWPKVASYARGKMINLFDPAHMFAEDSTLREQMDIEHKGFYIGVVSSSDDEIVREGFLQDKQPNILDSIDIVLNNVFGNLKGQGISRSAIETSSFHFTLVKECLYIKNPLHWDESRDGICFQWGQRYKSIYVPYQINRSSHTKHEIMDRLCGWEAGVPSNLWRMPEGLCWRLVCDSHAA